MEVAKIQVGGTCACAYEKKTIRAGMVGVTVSFAFDEYWDGLNKIAVYRCGGVVRDEYLEGDTGTIPAEVLTKSGFDLEVGVYGTDAEKQIAIPTCWANLGVVRPGADPSGDPAADPSLPIWAQILAKLGNLADLSTEAKENLVAAINEALTKGGGEVDPEEIGRIVDEYLEQNPPAAYTLPIATETTLGGVKAAAATEEMTQPVGITADGKLVTAPGQNSGGNVDHVGVEPAEDDIPKIFFGGALQQTKDEAVVPFRYISKTEDFSGYAEIKAQGNSSMSYPKKNQTVKMFADEACESKMKKDFKGWGKQNKHVYKANWIDLTHARNVVSARIWADIVKSRSNYAELPELLKTSPNQGAVDGFPVKVYADGVYQGRYTINIPKDKWMANMDDELDTHCILCGEGYVSGCFREVSTTQWTDEIHDSMPTTIANRWKEVISFVMNSTDEEFRANLGNYFDVQSLIDYHLYGLISCGLDAYGKNQLYMTYDGQKWIASMYDMDSTWGLYWNGSKFVATDYDRSQYQDFVDGNGNLLYIRLEQLFCEELQARWTELKSNALSMTNIINRFERFTDITPLDLVKEDYASTTGGGKFSGIPSQLTNNIQQIRSFALARQAWTDEYVTALTGESGGETEKTLTSISATYTGGDVPVGTAVTDLTGIVVTATYSDGSTATVTGYTLSGEIAEGENTVTVSYSGKTTTFAVVGVAESGGDEPESDNIDYTLNPLDGVVYTDKHVYDRTTGDMVTNNTNNCTSKFALQNCMYKLSDANAKYKSISVWDENGIYIGQTLEYPSASDYVFNGIAGYTYAINFYDTTGGNTLTLMPVDNSANKTEPVVIDLTTGWVDGGNGAVLYIGDLCASAGLTATTHINSVAGLVLFTSPLFGSWANVPMISFYKDSGLGGFALRSANAKTATEAAAYYAEHCPTLTING